MENPLIGAIHSGRLYQCIKDLEAGNSAFFAENRGLVERGKACCDRIGEETLAVQNRLIGAFRAAHIEVKPLSTSHAGKQYHEFVLWIDGDQLEKALLILRQEGFAVDDVLLDKWQAVRACSTELYLMAWDKVSTRLLLRWSDGPRGKLAKLRPVPADYAFAPIPVWMAPLYFAVKPVRFLFEKATGVRTADRLGLKSGSFSLGTPPDLLDYLFDEVALGPTDVLVDLGCGDGRVLIAAAKRFGCRAIGVERNQSLVTEARKKAKAEGAAELVSIQHAEISQAPLQEATVVFLFLPVELVPGILAHVRQSVPSGARILVHEQRALKTPWRPDRQVPVFAKNSLTIAHVWTTQ